MNPLEKNLPEVAWVNTNLPLSERLTHLQHHEAVAAEPREGRGGAADNSPGGVAIRSKPLRSRRAASGAESDAAAGADFFEIARKKTPTIDGDGEGGERARKARGRRLRTRPRT